MAATIVKVQNLNAPTISLQGIQSLTKRTYLAHHLIHKEGDDLTAPPSHSYRPSNLLHRSASDPLWRWNFGQHCLEGKHLGSCGREWVDW